MITTHESCTRSQTRKHFHLIPHDVNVLVSGT